MRRLGRVLGLILLLFLLCGCLVEGASEGSFGVITGRILWADQKGIIDPQFPLSWITIHIEGTNCVTTSGIDGRFSLDDVPAGSQVLNLINHGCEINKRIITVKADTQTALGDIPMHFDRPEQRIDHFVMYLNNTNLGLELRKAIALATDKDTLVDLLSDKFELMPSHQFILLPGIGYNETIVHTYDLKAASELVKKNKLKNSPIRIMSPQHICLQLMAEILAEDLEDIGLSVQLEIIDGKTLFEVFDSKDYDLLLMQFSTGIYYSPIPSLYSFLHSNGNHRTAGVDPDIQAQLDNLIDSAVLAIDRDEFEALVAKIDALARENYIFIPLMVK